MSSAKCRLLNWPSSNRDNGVEVSYDVLKEETEQEWYEQASMADAHCGPKELSSLAVEENSTVGGVVEHLDYLD